MEQRQPQVAWRAIRGLGNVLRHEYDVVDEATVRRIVERELSPLREACLDELNARG